MLFNYIFEIIYIFSPFNIIQNAITHVNFFKYWNNIDEILKHSFNLDALLGINATITTIFITLAFFLMDVKKDNPDSFFWDLKVIFTQVLKIKSLMFNLILLVIPLLFWDLKIKLLILIFYLIGIINITFVLINSYKWIVSVQEETRQTEINFKNNLRKKYIVSMNDLEPITDVFASLMNSTSYTTINQLGLSELFKTKITQIRKNKNIVLYNQLWSVYLQSYTQEKDFDKDSRLVSLFDNSKYLEDFFDTYFSEMKVILKLNQEAKTTQTIDLPHSFYFVILHTFERKRGYFPIPIFQTKLYAFIDSLDIETIPRFISINGMQFIRELITFNLKNPKEEPFNNDLPGKWTITSANLANYQKDNASDSEKFNLKILRSFFVQTLNILMSTSERPNNGITSEQKNNSQISKVNFIDYRQSLFEMMFPLSDPIISGKILSFIIDAQNDVTINRTEEEHKLFWHSVILLGYKFNFHSNYKINQANFFESYTNFEEIILEQTNTNISEFINILKDSKYLLERVNNQNIEKIINYISGLEYNIEYKNRLMNSISTEIQIKKINEKYFNASKNDILNIAQIIVSATEDTNSLTPKNDL
ncbi:hypothetical protein [Leuconostoc mesenteroides]|uniref:hypothetical protein n=1 Tax=Leuconostoc mesenteroides TaxID=1245 RepID=UPI0023614BF5|nr:hypothetical protein [Leuconostoc mesenteroides]